MHLVHYNRFQFYIIKLLYGPVRLYYLNVKWELYQLFQAKKIIGPPLFSHKRFEARGR